MAGGVTLLMGAAGAAIGSAFGNPMIGAKIGLTIGALLDPGPQSDPGRTKDLRFGGSSMGASIPIVWGKARVPATLFWAATNPDGSIFDLNGGGKSKGKGGGGGPQHAVFTFAGSVCMGSMYAPDGTNITRHPVINKIWAADVVLWNVSDTSHANNPAMHPSGGQTFENQTADSTISGFLHGNTANYRGLLYWVFSGLDCYDFGNTLPTFTTEVQTDPVTVANIVEDICFMAGIDSDDVDVSAGTTTFVDGYVCLSSMQWQDALANLLLPMGFDLVKHSKKLILVKRGGASSKTILAADLGPSRSRTDESSSLSIETGHYIDQYTVCELSYYDTGSNYENGIALSPYAETGLSPNKWRVSTNLCLNNLTARRISSYLMDTARVEYDGTNIKFKLSWAFLDVVAADILIIPWSDDPTSGQLSDSYTKRVRVTEAQLMAGSDEGLIEITAVRDEAGVVEQSAIINGSGGSGAINVKSVGTEIVLINFIAISPTNGLFDPDQNSTPGVLVAANSNAYRWAASVWYSFDSGPDHYISAGSVPARGIWGTVNSGGTPADYTGGAGLTGGTSKVIFTADSSTLSQVNTEVPGAFAANGGTVNRYLVGNELITAGTGDPPSGAVCTLEGLFRAWRNSPSTGHIVGENVIFLGDTSGSRARPYLWIPLTTSAIGTTVYIKVLGVGQSLSDISSGTAVSINAQPGGPNGLAVIPTSVSASPAWPVAPTSEVITYSPVFSASISTPQTYDWQYATSTDGTTWSSWSSTTNTPGPFVGPAMTSGYQKAQCRATNSNGATAWVSSSSQAFASGTVSSVGTPGVDLFNGNGSTTGFTLSHAPNSGAMVLVFVDNVLQRPSSDYSISGVTLTFTSAPDSGTNNVDVRYYS